MLNHFGAVSFYSFPGASPSKAGRYAELVAGFKTKMAAKLGGVRANDLGR